MKNAVFRADGIFFDAAASLKKTLEAKRSGIVRVLKAPLSCSRGGYPEKGLELINVLSRVSCQLERNTIMPYDLPSVMRKGREIAAGAQEASLGRVIDAAEKEAIVEALKSTGNNKTAAAALLGIHRTHLYKKMKKYGM